MVIVDRFHVALRALAIAARSSRLLLPVALLPFMAATAYAQPAAPSGTWAGALATSIKVGWNPVYAASSYSIYRGTTEGGESPTPIATGLTGSPYTDTAVTVGQTYYYKVQAFYGNNGGPLSPECSANPGSTVLAASVIYGVAGGPGSNTAQINISPVTGAAEYDVFRSQQGGQYELIGKTIPLQYTDSTVSAGITYSYVVRAVVTNGAGANSNAINVIPGDLPPAQAVFVTAESAATNTTNVYVVNLAWNPVPGAVNYVISRSTTSGGTYVAIGVSNYTTFQDTNVTTGDTYYYKVAAVDESGAGSFSSSPASATASGINLYAPVIGATTTSSSVSLHWTGVNGAAIYIVYRRVGTGSFIAIGTTASPAYTDTYVSSGTAYTYEVAAIAAEGRGYLSNTATGEPGDPELGTPTGLFVVVNGSGSALTWDPTPGATSYDVYRGNGLIGVTNNTSYDDSGLVSGTTYQYYVKPVYNGGEGLASATVSVKAGSTPLSAPSLGMTETNSAVNLSWSLVPGATSYVVVREAYTYPIDSRLIIANITPGQGATSGTYTDMAVSTSTDYSYIVAATNANGTGIFSPYPVYVSPGSVSPSAPTGIAATTGGTPNITIKWNTTTPTADYFIYRSSTPGGEGVIPIGYSTTGSWTDTTAVADNVYYYEVKATDGENFSAFSPECSAEPSTTPVAAPVLTAYPGNSSITIQWSAIGGAASYNIYRTNEAGSAFILYQMGVTGTSFQDTNVLNSNIYYYQVQAVAAFGAGNLSSTATARVASIFDGETTGVYATPSGAHNVITWNPVLGAQTYNVFRATASGGEGQVPIATQITGTTFTDSTAIGGQTYYYTISAVTPDTQGPQASTVECSCTTSTAPLSPTTLVGNVVSQHVVLTWGAVTGATSYNIFRNDSTGWVLYVQGYVPSGSPSYTDTAVINDLTYQYMVAPTSVAGTGTKSNAVTETP